MRDKKSITRNSKGMFASIDHSDIIGKRFGKLTVMSIDHIAKPRTYWYKCKCDCGNDTVKERSALINGVSTKCMDCYKEEKMLKAANEYIGKRFGRLEVLELDHIEDRKGGSKNAHDFIYKCKCDCGNTVLIGKYNLSQGTKSCGCLAREVARENHITHGMSGTRFYNTWGNMIDRCSNPNYHNYAQYGGRGIIVCDRWKSFENFRDDMYESYCDHVNKYGERDTTIERINVNGNYELSNCTWATIEEQNRNMTTNIRLYYHGIEYIAIDLKRMFCPNISDVTYYDRLKYYGYENGSVINESTCYDTIFKGTHIQQAIRFIDKDESQYN